MKRVVAAALGLFIATGSAWGQSRTTGRADDNYGSNAAAGNNASSASTDQSANKAASAKTKKSVTDRKAANQPAPGNSPAETAGAATPNDTSRQTAKPVH